MVVFAYMREANRRNTLVLFAAFIGIFAPLSFANAQTPPPPTFGGTTAAVPQGTINCFDYYSFGSVQVDVTARVSSAVSGAPVTFTGTIKNANPYPIVDGAIYVKIL